MVKMDPQNLELINKDSPELILLKNLDPSEKFGPPGT